MCRILVYIGSADSIRRHSDELIRSFKEVSRYDWIFDKYTKGKEKSHSDGWGFLGYEHSIGRKITLYKSLNPFYEDDVSPLYKWIEYSNGLVVLLLHVRAKSENMERNIFSVHPIYAESPDGSQIYVIHNGTLNKEPLAKLVGESVESPRYSMYNDTYYAARIISNMNVFNVSKLKSLLEIFSQSKYLYSAFNFGLLWLSKGHSYLVVGPMYRTMKGKELVDYYRFYLAEGEDFDLYLSSTNVEWLERHDTDLSFEEVPNGRIMIYPDLDIDSSEYFQLPRIL